MVTTAAPKPGENVIEWAWKRIALDRVYKKCELKRITREMITLDFDTAAEIVNQALEQLTDDERKAANEFFKEVGYPEPRDLKSPRYIYEFFQYFTWRYKKLKAEAYEVENKDPEEFERLKVASASNYLVLRHIKQRLLANKEMLAAGMPQERGYV
ncbi:MAG: hypothetical protein ACXQS2_05995 [Methermicoccaceae archaeon]